MSRYRIRTVKPEMRQDERYGRLSRDARELFNGLITMADDEGRLRALSTQVLGHIFPYDDDAARKLAGWMAEVVESRMVLAYEHDELPYLAFRHWARHQHINRPKASVLPPPPDSDVITANAVNQSRKDHGSIMDDAQPPAQARVPIRSFPTGEQEPHKEKEDAGALDRARIVKQVFDEWIVATERDPTRTKLTPDRRRCIEKALASHGLEDCLAAVQHIGADAWAGGANERGRPFNDIHHALGSGTRLERWRDQQPRTAVVSERDVRRNRNADALKRLMGGGAA